MAEATTKLQITNTEYYSKVHCNNNVHSLHLKFRTLAQFKGRGNTFAFIFHFH